MTGIEAFASNALNRTIAQIIDENGCSIEEAVTDVLADIRHLCEARKIDYYDCDRIAYEHYLVERQEIAGAYHVQPAPPYYVWSSGTFGRIPESGGDIDSIPF